jgi:hypothetical protein
MSNLKIKRLDSPLARGTQTAAAPAKQQPTTAPPRRERQPQPAAGERRPSSAKLAAVAVQDTATEDSSRHVSPVPDDLDGLPDPPLLTEPLELLSTRLPVSLRRAISDMTVALRARQGGRASQKALPEQEVLATLVWLAGSADDPAAVDRLGRSLAAYRARRYAAEARALRPANH